MRPLLQAWKATLVLNLLSALGCAVLLTLGCGHRLPLGTFGVSILSDPQGRPYVVVDHTSRKGWLLAYDHRHRRVEAWEGTIRLQ